MARFPFGGGHIPAIAQPVQVLYAFFEFLLDFIRRLFTGLLYGLEDE